MAVGQQPRQQVSAHVSSRSALYGYGGGVVIISGLCGLVAYGLAYLVAPIFRQGADRAKTALSVAQHAAFVCGIGALVGAIALLGVRGW